MGAGPGGHIGPYISGFEETRRFLGVPKRVPILVSKLGPSEALSGTPEGSKLTQTAYLMWDPKLSSFWGPTWRASKVRICCYL